MTASPARIAADDIGRAAAHTARLTGAGPARCAAVYAAAYGAAIAPPAPPTAATRAARLRRWAAR